MCIPDMTRIADIRWYNLNTERSGGEKMKMDIKTENGISVAKLYGEIDHHCAAGLRKELDRYIISAQPRTLAMDLNSISFMDSAGIGLIMGRSKLMKECGGRLEVWHPQPYIRRVLKLSGIERLVRIV